MESTLSSFASLLDFKTDLKLIKKLIEQPVKNQEHIKELVERDLRILNLLLVHLSSFDR